MARDAREKALAEIETGMAKQRAKEAEDKKSLVGKTPAQCNEKYGKPDAEGEGYAIYQKADIYISVNFWKGRAAKILYTKTQDEIGMSDDFTDAEFQTIMGINSSGGEWELTSKHLFYNTYASGDKSRGCYYDKRHHTLTVSTAEFSKVMAEAEAAAEKDRLKDL